MIRMNLGANSYNIEIERGGLLKAGQYVQTIEENQGIKIACLEEIAYRMGFLSKEIINNNAEKYKKNELGIPNSFRMNKKII